MSQGLLFVSIAVQKAVAAGAAPAFGFVFKHPFEDGNGRNHRWLMHHVWARAAFTPSGIIFPVSAAILRNMSDYKILAELGRGGSGPAYRAENAKLDRVGAIALKNTI